MLSSMLTGFMPQGPFYGLQPLDEVRVEWDPIPS